MVSAEERYKLKPIHLDCEVKGVDLKTENGPEVINHVRREASTHSLLIEDQCVLSGDKQVEINEWFGKLESTSTKFSLPALFRVSSDEEEDCTGVGITGWHMEGSLQQSPFSYALNHEVSVPKNEATSFAPMANMMKLLLQHKRDKWDRLWILSDRTGSIHPLIYRHSVTNKGVLSFHLGMAGAFIYDYDTAAERFASKEETYRLLKEINEELLEDESTLNVRYNSLCAQLVTSLYWL